MTADGGVFAPASRALTLGILLSITAVAFEGMAVATIMPSVAVELGGLGAYGWAFSIFMLASLIGVTSAGQIADRRGPSLPAISGFATFAIGLCIAGTSLSWPLLLVGRAVQGFGAGALGAVAYVAVARGYPEAQRPRLLALLSSAWILPSLIGPALAGQIAEHATWRLVFFGILPPVALGAWMLLPSLSRLPATLPAETPPHDTTQAAPSGVAETAPASPTPPSGASRVLASLRLMAGVALVLFAAGITELPFGLPVIALIAATGTLPIALAVGALGFVLAIPALTQLLPAGTVTAARGLPASVALRGLLAFAFFSAETVIPLGLATQRGVPLSIVGISLTAGALAWVAGSWLQDRAESRSNGALTARSARVIAGLVLLATGIAASAVATIVPDSPIAAVVAGWAIAGLGMGLTYPATTLTALGLAAPGQEGHASASLQVAETVGVATSTGAAGALFALAPHLSHSPTDGLSWAFALSLAAALLALAPAARLVPGARRPVQSSAREPEPASI